VKKKLKAFTLLELLIGMVVSTIVVAIGYAAYTVVYKQYLQYKLLREEMVEIAAFKNEFQNNFYHSKIIKADDNSIYFEFSNNKKVKFTFFDTFITRQVDGLTDTFKVENNNRVKVYIDESNTEIKDFVFNSILFNEPIVFSFQKQYSSEYYIKHDLQSLNND
jgi:prepilin-type N-terminal cleavage/methylation domain-containing protein